MRGALLAKRAWLVLVVVGFVASIGAGGLAAASGAGSSAVAYQVDIAHSGVQVDDALVPPFSLRWQATLPGAISYPLIAQGLVFVISGDNNAPTTLYALDQSTGQAVWSQPISTRHPRAGAAYDAGKVFVVANNPTCCSSGRMYAYDAATGAPLWTADLPGQYLFSSPPTAAGGVVYTGGAGSGGTLYAVDEATGNVLATQPVQNGDQSAPALSPTDVFVSYACNQAYGFSRTTLTPVWHYNPGCSGGGGKTPVVANGRVFTRDFSGNLALDAATGTPLGSYAPSGQSIPAPAVAGDSMWVLSGGALRATSIPSFSELWSFTGDGQLSTAPIVLSSATGRLVVVGSGSGMLYALDSTTGTVVWSAGVAGGPISGPDEQNLSEPLSGMGAGEGLLVVPAGRTLSTFVHSVAPANCDLSRYPRRGGVAYLKNANLAGCYLPGASLAGANISNANLNSTFLANANLAGANFTNSNLRSAILESANLTSANLSGANLRDARLGGATLTNVRWFQTTCPDGTLSNANGGTCIGHL